MTNDVLTEGNVFSRLVKFTIPITLALLLQVAYGTVDLIIVGNFASIADVSGVSTGSQLVALITSLCTGLGMGITVLIGRYIGANSFEKVNMIIINAVVFFFTLAVFLTASILIFESFLLDFLNTPADAFTETSNYIFYSAIGIPMIFAYNVLGSIFRGLGDSKTPLFAVAIACVSNIILDLILVGACNMGAAGASIATVCAQLISVVISLILIKYKSKFNFYFKKHDISFKNILLIIKNGAPMALQSVLTSLSFMFITIIVNQYGIIYSSAVGLSEKATGLIMLIPLSFMQSIAVFVSQNNGANKPERAQKGFRVGLAISMTFGTAMALFTYFGGEYIAYIFNQDPELLAATSEYLRAYAFDTFLVSILFCLIGYLNGCNKTTFLLIQGIVGACLLRIPLAYIFSQIEPFTLFTMGLATPIGSFTQIVIICVYLFIIRKQLNLKK
ncbi:MAG: MATE family efflux transporter [Bacillota bacterium]